MPSAANKPAPARAPQIRAVSDVVRAMPMAPISCSGGMVWATIVWRTARSDGRTRPHRAPMTSTTAGLSAPPKAISIRVAASVA